MIKGKSQVRIKSSREINLGSWYVGEIGRTIWPSSVHLYTLATGPTEIDKESEYYPLCKVLLSVRGCVGGGIALTLVVLRVPHAMMLNEWVNITLRVARSIYPRTDR